LLILSQSINKHGHHRRFLFLIGLFLKKSYHVSYHLAKRFQRKSCFRNRTIRNKNCLWRPCLLTDQNGMSNSHRRPSIDASHRRFLFLIGLFLKKSSPLKPHNQMIRNLVGSIYGKSPLINIAHFVPIW
jgi:hypothetical protein